MDKAAKTYRILNRSVPPKAGRPIEDPGKGSHGVAQDRKAVPCPTPRKVFHKVEPYAVPLTILDRRAGNYQSLRRSQTGIPFCNFGKYSVDIVNGVYQAFRLTHQQCWNAYRYGSTDSESLKHAKHAYYQLQRSLFRWKDVLRFSRFAQQYWKVISLVFRFAKDGAKRRGRPLSGSDRDTLVSACKASAYKSKVIASFPEGSSTKHPSKSLGSPL